MVRSTELVEELQQKIPAEDWKLLGPEIVSIVHQQGRRARKNIVQEINRVLVETAIRDNKPLLLSAIPELEGTVIEPLFSRIITKYIQTRDDIWLKIFYDLSSRLERKSNQSHVFAMIARDLIDAGVTEADSGLIDMGLAMLDRISFRKYRSDIMIDIIPLLIVWAVTIRDKKLLGTSLSMINEIADISKRSVIHAELVKALATIAIQDRDRVSFINSILSTMKIHQKLRRQQCLAFIIEKGAKSHFGREMAEISHFIRNFSELPEDVHLEVISALTEQMLERVKDKTHIQAILEDLCIHNIPATGSVIVDLLNKAEKSGDLWFLSTAMQFQNTIRNEAEFPVREIVRSAVAIASKSNDMKVLLDLIPTIKNSCDSATLSKIYLQFSQIMLTVGDFDSALGIITEIRQDTENPAQYIECVTHLFKEGIVKDAVFRINQKIVPNLNSDTANIVIARAVTEFCRESPFDSIISHEKSMMELITLHPRQDHLLLQTIAELIERGFLDSCKPDTLIHIAESIRDQQHKERAISNIVIKIAKIGVQTKNRDFLQRAVGLTCEIDGQNTRSATLCSIIDDASILAAQQGDLDLLLRMKVWSSSLLEKDLAAFAMANIVNGIIKYALNRQSPDALEQAHQIAQEINDPALKTQLFEHIAECLVKIGCILMNNSRTSDTPMDLDILIQPFERGLEILTQSIKSPRFSLKIAGMIDVILSYSHSSNDPRFFVPLALYTVEIENTYERDAMLSRIISTMSEEILYPDSTDPYEIMVFILQRDDRISSCPGVARLISRLIQRISNPYSRLTGLCNLLKVQIKADGSDTSNQTLNSICSGLPALPAEFQKILILMDLAILFSDTDLRIASNCIHAGIRKLEAVEYDKEALVRKQIVVALVRINTASPRKEWSDIAFNIVQKITDPVDSINGLTLVYTMLPDERERCRELINLMITTAERIHSPYEKASVLLNIVRLALQDENYEKIAVSLLKTTELITKKINISSVSDNIRDTIAQIYLMLYQTSHQETFLSQAIQIAKTLEDDNIRLRRYFSLGFTEKYEITPPFIKIKTLSEALLGGGVHSNQIIVLERLVRTVADRGKESLIFCDLANVFKKSGDEKLFHRMMQNALREARIIRPLSRRAFVLCDIALKTYSAGSEQMAQEILDDAIDAATNIRQSTIRDEVFDELGHAIKTMQGISIT